MNIIMTDSLPVQALFDETITFVLNGDVLEVFAASLLPLVQHIRPYFLCPGHLKHAHLDVLVQVNQHPDLLAGSIAVDDIIVVVSPDAWSLCLTEASSKHALEYGLVVEEQTAHEPGAQTSVHLAAAQATSPSDVGDMFFSAMQRPDSPSLDPCLDISKAVLSHIPGAPEVLEVTGVSLVRDEVGEWVNSGEPA